jgi:hypothetical protein
MFWSRFDDLSVFNHGVVKLVETCTELGVPLTSNAVSVIFVLNIPTDEKARLLAKIGAGRILGSWVSFWSQRRSIATHVFAAMLQQQRNAAEWYRILRAVSYLPPFEGLGRVPEELLRGMRAASDDLRRAALKLKVDSVTWRDDESTELSRVAMELPSHQLGYLGDLAEFIESTDRRGSHIESFLVELLSLDSPTLNQPTRNMLASLLVKVVDRRPAVSELPDPQPKSVQAPTARRH